jgi:hypothetical protein
MHRRLPRLLVLAIGVMVALCACQPLTTRPLTDAEVDAFVAAAADAGTTAMQSASAALWDVYEDAVANATQEELEALRNDALMWAESARRMLEVDGIDPRLAESLLSAVEQVETAVAGDDAEAIVAALVNGHTVVALAEQSGVDTAEMLDVVAPATLVDRVPGAREVLTPRATAARPAPPSVQPPATPPTPPPPVAPEPTTTVPGPAPSPSVTLGPSPAPSAPAPQPTAPSEPAPAPSPDPAPFPVPSEQPPAEEPASLPTTPAEVIAGNAVGLRATPLPVMGAAFGAL